MTGAAIGGIFATVNRYCSARLWRPPASPLNIVVTGSTRGLGKALAREFLAHGDSVVVTGRTPAAVAQAIAEVKQELAGFGLSAVGSLHRGGSKQQQQQAAAAPGSTQGSSSSSGPRLYGVVCDVTKAQSVADLAAQAQVGSECMRSRQQTGHPAICCSSPGFQQRWFYQGYKACLSMIAQVQPPAACRPSIICVAFQAFLQSKSNYQLLSRRVLLPQELLGTVDVWVCNAGYSGSFKPFLAAEPETLEAVVKTNLLGTLLCAREAGKIMLQQQLGGHIFIMDGAGADGSATPQYAAYGAWLASSCVA